MINATRTNYPAVESYMLSRMNDSAHDAEHVYRVLNYALDIAQHESDVHIDVLSIACLFHDIARSKQYADPTVDHAVCGAEMAYQWLVENGYSIDFAEDVKKCIHTHRFRSKQAPESIEAMILFDADKLDACGAMGIARTLLYKALVAEPLYTLTEDGAVSNGTNDTEPSFFQEYKFKLEKLYDNFYTVWGAELAAERRNAAEHFYVSLSAEATECYSQQLAGTHR